MCTEKIRTDHQEVGGRDLSDMVLQERLPGLGWRRVAALAGSVPQGELLHSPVHELGDVQGVRLAAVDGIETITLTAINSADPCSIIYADECTAWGVSCPDSAELR